MASLRAPVFPCRLGRMLLPGGSHAGATDAPQLNMTKRAVIIGVTGQDGSYLAELLLEQGYEVHGVVRRASTETFERIHHLSDKIHLHQERWWMRSNVSVLARRTTPWTSSASTTSPTRSTSTRPTYSTSSPSL